RDAEELEREPVETERLVVEVRGQRGERKPCLALPARPALALSGEPDREVLETIGIARERKRGAHVGGHRDLDRFALEREARAKRESRLGAKARGFEIEVAERPSAAGCGVVPRDLRVADEDLVDAEVDGARAAALGRRGLLRRRVRTAAEILPVVPALRVAREVQHEPVERRLADRDSARKQRQELEVERGALDLGERLVAEALRVAQRSEERRVGKERRPRRARSHLI